VVCRQIAQATVRSGSGAEDGIIYLQDRLILVPQVIL